MKKVYLPVLVFCLIAGVAKAQKTANANFSWGYKIGLNASNLRMSGGNSDWKTGLATGLFFNVKLAGRLSLQPELLYSSMGGDNVPGTPLNSRLRLNYFSVPLMAKYKVCNSFALMAGPQVDVLINAKTKQGEQLTKVDNNYRDNSTSLTGGFEFWPVSSLGLSARYIHGLTNVWGGNAMEMKNQAVQLTAAIRF